jgi:hypothetical protein
VPAKDRRNAWTPGGIAIDQVSKYKYLGVVYQEDGSWQAHAQRRLQRCKQPMGTGGHCCHAAVCRQRSDCSWFLHLFRGHVWRGSVDTTKAVKDKMSAVVKKALRSILALHPRDCSSDVLGTLGYFHPVYSLMLPNCVGSTDARTWRLADGPRRRRFSFEGSRGVGRPKVGTDCAVMSNPLLSRSSTP